MLKQLRLKFICITMAIVTVMLTVIFTMVLHFTARNLEQQSLNMLYEVGGNPMHMGPPGKEVRMPYFVLQEGPGGTVRVMGGESFDLSDTEFLADILSRASATRENTGVLEEYDLRYYRSKGGPGVSIVFADISGERQTLRSLTVTCIFIGAASFGALLVISFLLAKWAVKPVERAWQEQRKFVADASHELKTPLTVIMTNAELLAEEAGGERQRQFVGSIQTMSVQMRGLVEGLLELARVDNGAVRKSFQSFCLSDALMDAVLPFEAVFFEAGLRLETELTPGISIKGSAGHIRQVVEILLDNARKYSTPGTQVRLSLERSGSKECLLRVTNEGQPIDQEDLKNIFKRFYRADKVRTMNHSYGLGLSIAQSIVEDHGGKIWAASENGINTFFVQLPIK